MIVDIGGGTTDVAVISLGGTVVSTSIKVAGDNFDEAIMRYVRKNYNLIIGERTAEAKKDKDRNGLSGNSSTYNRSKGQRYCIRLPKSAEISSEEIREALAECIAQIMEVIHSVMKTPPELVRMLLNVELS